MADADNSQGETGPHKDFELGMSDFMVTQATSLAVQDQVDAIRNEATIKNTAMGNMYAKWLTNPVMGSEFKEMLNSLTSKSSNDVEVNSPEHLSSLNDIVYAKQIGSID